MSETPICGAETTTGAECSRQVSEADDRCFQHSKSEGSDSTEIAEGDYPTEQAFYEEYGHFLISLTGAEKWEDRSEAYRAAREVIDRVTEGQNSDAKAEVYCDFFGVCSEGDCSKGSNGWDSDYCWSHQPKAEEDNNDGDEEGSSEAESVLEQLKSLPKGERAAVIAETLEE